MYPYTIFYPACLHYTGRKECRGTFFPAHYKGNEVTNSVILSIPLTNLGQQQEDGPRRLANESAGVQTSTLAGFPDIMSLL